MEKNIIALFSVFILVSSLYSSKLDGEASKIDFNVLHQKTVDWMSTKSTRERKGLSISEKRKANQYFENLKGSVVDWNLTFFSIYGGPGSYSVTTKDGDFKATITFKTENKKQIDALESLVRGDKINIKGILTGKITWTFGINVSPAKLISVNNKRIVKPAEGNSNSSLKCIVFEDKNTKTGKIHKESVGDRYTIKANGSGMIFSAISESVKPIAFNYLQKHVQSGMTFKIYRSSKDGMLWIQEGGILGLKLNNEKNSMLSMKCRKL